MTWRKSDVFLFSLLAHIIIFTLHTCEIEAGLSDPVRLQYAATEQNKNSNVGHGVLNSNSSYNNPIFDPKQLLENDENSVSKERSINGSHTNSTAHKSNYLPVSQIPMTTIEDELPIVKSPTTASGYGNSIPFDQPSQTNQNPTYDSSHWDKARKNTDDIFERYRERMAEINNNYSERLDDIGKKYRERLDDFGKTWGEARQEKHSHKTDSKSKCNEKHSNHNPAQPKDTSSEISLYDVLEVSDQASASELKTAFRKMALKNHPDKVKPENETDKQKVDAKMALINRAKEVLLDSRERGAYDRCVKYKLRRKCY